MKILVIASADSHLKWCYTVAKKISSGGEVDIFAPSDTGHDVDYSILENMGIKHPFTSAPLEELSKIYQFGSYHAIVTILTERLFSRLHSLLSLWVETSGTKRRPALVTGFPGITMKLVGVLPKRQGADVICVNTLKDLKEANQLASALGLDDVHVSSGYPFASDLPKAKYPIVTPNRGRKIVFTTQPHWPGKLEERLYILEQLVRGAWMYPNDKFVIKLRLQEGKKSVHHERYHYEAIMPQVKLLRPSNLHFAYGPISDIFSDADMHITLSSTSAIESIAMGVPTSIIGDFGPHDGYGVHHFIGSNMIQNIDVALSSGANEPAHDWLMMNGFSPESSLSNAIDAINAFHGVQSECSECAPVKPLFYVDSNFKYEFWPKYSRKNPSRLKVRKRKRARMASFIKQIIPYGLVKPTFRLAKKMKIVG